MPDINSVPANLQEQAERIARELTIPPCPAILARFASEMNKEEPDLRRIADYLANDVALSASMLATVNSPYFGLRQKATTVRQALAILGLRASANLVTGLLLRNAFPVASGELMERFWRDSASLAEAAAELAGRIEGIQRDEAHTYALFRECGTAVMITRFEDYGSLLESCANSPGAGRLAEEEGRYRFSHARVGYALARGWLLPEPICEAIQFHHHFVTIGTGRQYVDPATAKLLAIGLLAEQVVALRTGRGLCPDWMAGEAFVLRTLELKPEQIVDLSELDAVAEL